MDKHENCGNQVEQKQIVQETCIQILSQIECEYNVDQLKRKTHGTDVSEHARITELYGLGINTLEALMRLLRLEKEWELKIKSQYVLEESVSADKPIPEASSYGTMIMNQARASMEEKEAKPLVDPDDLIRLLTRCKKMYEAKTLIQRLMKMIVERDRMVEDATQAQEEVKESKPTKIIDTSAQKSAAIGGTSQNIQLGAIKVHEHEKQTGLTKEAHQQIKRLTTRITSQINTLQEEHHIFKRPFILRGQEYLQ